MAEAFNCRNQNCLCDGFCIVDGKVLIVYKDLRIRKVMFVVDSHVVASR